MILCEEPYLNEPAWAQCGGTPPSKACETLLYDRQPISHFEVDSANVRRMVVRTAVSWRRREFAIAQLNARQMLGNLRNPPEPWEDVIRTHFRLKTRSITKQLNHWLQIDDGRQIAEDGAGIESRSSAAGSGGSSNGMKKDVDALIELMGSL